METPLVKIRKVRILLAAKKQLTKVKPGKQTNKSKGQDKNPGLLIFAQF
jgi:hypothetical protein